MTDLKNRVSRLESLFNVDAGANPEPSYGIIHRLLDGPLGPRIEAVARTHTDPNTLVSRLLDEVPELEDALLRLFEDIRTEASRKNG
jgi:hypothetical protein